MPIKKTITKLLEYIGEDPHREGLQETPERVIKAYDLLCSGYKQNPKDLIKTFDSDGYDQMVVLKEIELYSLCEHHLLPFIGKAHVAYIPDKKVIGISKIARLVDVFARRLQIQERLTDQIAQALWEGLEPKGVACMVEAFHLCMRMRGVSKQNSIMVTNSLKGVFISESEPREEFLNLIRR